MNMLGDVYNNLTRRLDELSDRQKMKDNNPELEYLYSHYLYKAYRDFPTGSIAIRVPGGTVGDVLIDDDGVILNIAIATDYVVSYSDNVKEIINTEFVGTKLEL